MEQKITTRKASNIQEERIAKKLKGIKSANSGAGKWDKYDVVVKEASLALECKTCINKKKSFSIKKEWLDKNNESAFINRLSNNVIAFNFHYNDTDDYYVIDDKLMKFLVKKLIEETI